MWSSSSSPVATGSVGKFKGTIFDGALTGDPSTCSEEEGPTGIAAGGEILTPKIEPPEREGAAKEKGEGALGGEELNENKELLELVEKLKIEGTGAWLVKKSNKGFEGVVAFSFSPFVSVLLSPLVGAVSSLLVPFSTEAVSVGFSVGVSVVVFIVVSTILVGAGLAVGVGSDSGTPLDPERLTFTFLLVAITVSSAFFHVPSVSSS